MTDLVHRHLQQIDAVYGITRRIAEHPSNVEPSVSRVDSIRGVSKVFGVFSTTRIGEESVDHFRFEGWLVAKAYRPRAPCGTAYRNTQALCAYTRHPHFDRKGPIPLSVGVRVTDHQHRYDPMVTARAPFTRQGWIFELNAPGVDLRVEARPRAIEEAALRRPIAVSR